MLMYLLVTLLTCDITLAFVVFFLYVCVNESAAFFQSGKLGLASTYTLMAVLVVCSSCVC